MTEIPQFNSSLLADSLSRSQSEAVIGGLKKGDKAKVEKSAHDFEALLVGKWLEQAEQSFATVPGEGSNKKEEDAGRDQLRSLGAQSLAAGLSAHGGIGLASFIIKHLAGEPAVPTGQTGQVGPVPRKGIGKVT